MVRPVARKGVKYTFHQQKNFYHGSAEKVQKLMKRLKNS
jgi:hypothetical protein